MDGGTDSPCVIHNFVPFGAAALLPLNFNQTLLKQRTADHLLPLDCYKSLAERLYKRLCSSIGLSIATGVSNKVWDKNDITMRFFFIFAEFMSIQT